MTKPRITRHEAGKVLAELLDSLATSPAAGLTGDVLGHQLAARAGTAAPRTDEAAPRTATELLLDRVERHRAHQERERLRAEGLDPDTEGKP